MEPISPPPQKKGFLSSFGKKSKNITISTSTPTSPTPIIKDSNNQHSMLIVEEFSTMTKQEVKEKLLSQGQAIVRSPSVEFEKKDDMATAETSDELSEEEKVEINRVAAIEELVTTETSYVADLQIIINIFYKPLKALRIIQEEEFKTIFSNIDAINVVNSEIDDIFKKAGKDYKNLNVGKLFLPKADLLRMYNVYSTNYEPALQMYHKLTKEKKEFVSFIRECESKPECRSLGLVGFLIKPVQRICKYPLVFREMLKSTRPNHPDFASLEQCLKKTLAIADYVNEKKRNVENLQKMLEIRDHMTDLKGLQLVHPARQFIRDGLIMKVNNYGKGQMRHMFLFSDLLVYTVPQLLRNTYQYKGSVSLDSCLVSDLPCYDKHKFAFSVAMSDKKKKYVLVFNTLEEKMTWMRDIQKYVELFLSKRNKELKNMEDLKQRRAQFKQSFSQPHFVVTPKQEKEPATESSYDALRRRKMTQESTSLNGLSLILAVRCNGVSLSTRVTLYSSVESVKNKIKIKLPGNTDNYKLYLGNLALDNAKKLSDYPAFIGAVGDNKNLETLTLEYKP